MNTKISTHSIMMIVNILFLIVLENFVLDSAIGFFSASGFLLLCVYMLLFGGLQGGISKMVNIRNHKGLNDNAKRILKPALIYILLAGVICVSVTFLSADYFCLNVWGNTYPAMVLKLFSVILVIAGITDSFCGYQIGEGNTIIVTIANMMRMVLPIVFSFIFLPSFEKYGNKVSALLKNNVATSAHLALAMACIYLTSAILIMITVIILSFRMRIVQKEDRLSRSAYSKKAVYGSLLSGVYKVALNRLFPIVSVSLAVILYLHYTNKCGIKPETAFLNVGAMFSKLFLPIAFVYMIFSEYVNREKYRLHLDYRKDEHKTAVIRGQYLIKNSFFMLLPPAIIFTFLADPFVKVFYTGQYALSAKILQTGGFLILFAGLSYALNSTLKATGRELTSLGIQIAAFAIQVLYLILILPGANGNYMVVLYSFYLYFAIEIVADFFVLYRFMRFELMEMLIKLGKYGIASVVMMILFIILDKFVMMNVLLIILSMILGYLLYYLTVLALKGITKKDEMALKRTLNYYPIAFLKSRLRL